MNIQEFRRRQAENNKDSVKMNFNKNPMADKQTTNKNKMIDSKFMNNKQIFTVDDVLYSKFDKLKNNGKNVLIKMNDQNFDDDGELKVNKKNRKILIKWLEQESKRINKSDY